MGNYPRKPNNIKKSEEASKEKQKNQKKQLLEQMKKKQETKDFTPKVSALPKNKSKASKDNEVGQLKNQLADLERRLKKVQKEAAADRKKVKIVKKQMKELENETQQKIEKTLNEAEAIKNNAKLEGQQVKKLVDQLQMLGWIGETNAVEELQRRSDLILLLLHQANTTNRYLKKVQKRDQTFNQEIRDLERKNHQLEIKNIGHTKAISRKDKKVKALESEIKNRREKQQELIRVIKKLRSTDPQELIPRLIRQLDKRTFRSFNQLNRLFEKYQWLFDYHAHSFSEKKTDVLYGFLEVRKEELYFHDINEELVLPLTTQKDFKRKDLLVDGMAVQVYRKLGDSDSVALGYCYPIVERKRTQRSHSRKHQQKNQESLNQTFLANVEVKKWASELTVAVVGNKQVQGLANQLKNVVKRVLIIDAYEKGERRTTDLIRSSDYTFILIDSVPHNVTNFAKDYDPLSQKVQMIRPSAKLDGLLWLNYLYWNREEES